MGINFPASPTIGDIYPTPAQPGVPQWQWNGTTWKAIIVDTSGYLLKSQNLADVPDKAVARTNLGITPSVVMRATRNVGQETFAIGNFPILGVFTLNRGGWTAGAGNGIAVPVSGLYRLTNRLYVNGPATSARVGITLNGAAAYAFVQLSGTAGFSGTQESTDLVYLPAGSLLGMTVNTATAVLYTMAQHTELFAELLEAY